VFELTSNEPFVVTYQKGISCAIHTKIVSKLNQDAVFDVEDDLTDLIVVACQDHIDVDDLLIWSKVIAFVVFPDSTGFASLFVTKEILACIERRLDMIGLWR